MASLRGLPMSKVGRKPGGIVYLASVYDIGNLLVSDEIEVKGEGLERQIGRNSGGEDMLSQAPLFLLG